MIKSLVPGTEVLASRMNSSVQDSTLTGFIQHLKINTKFSQVFSLIMFTTHNSNAFTFSKLPKEKFIYIFRSDSSPSQNEN